jgi:anti-anti-sigma regulatory factor
VLSRKVNKLSHTAWTIYALSTGEHGRESFEMIRVTSRRAENKTIIQIDGELRSDFVEELGRFASSAEPPVTFDLTDLRSMDSESADSFVKLAQDVAAVIGASPFIRLLLERHGLAIEE